MILTWVWRLLDAPCIMTYTLEKENLRENFKKTWKRNLKPYHDSTNLVLVDSDGVPIHSNMYLPDIRDCCVSPVIIPLSD